MFATLSGRFTRAPFRYGSSMAAVSVTGHVSPHERAWLRRCVDTSSWWAAGVLAVVLAVAASQFVSWLWIGQSLGVAHGLTRAAIAAVGVVVMVASGAGRCARCRCPAGPAGVSHGGEGPDVGGRLRHRHGRRGRDRLHRPLGVRSSAEGNDGVPVGTAWTTTLGELWRVAVVPAVSEEFVFRFVLLIVLARVLPIRWAVLAQAVVFAAAHTAFGMGFGVFGEADKPYLIDGFVSTGLTGLLLAYLAVELATIWPAILLHFTVNAVVVLHVIGGLWLDLAVEGSIFVGLVVFVLAGLLGLRRSVGLPQRRALGLNLGRQWRMTRRFGPLVCQSPLLRRPLTWADERPFADWPSVYRPRWWPRRSRQG